MSDLVIYNNPEALKQIEAFTSRLNVDPKKESLQDTPDKKAKYIPIGIIENELRQDFAGLVQYEIISERRELNEYIVAARIKVFHPVILQWLSFDGIGATQIMQDSGANLSSFSETKKKNALETNAPKAYAEAIKNAAKKIGKKYGADINRKFEDSYEPLNTIASLMDEVIEKLNACATTAELMEVWNEYPELQKSNKFKAAFSKRKGDIQ